MDSVKTPPVCCIGGGKMGEALIGGLLASGRFKSQQISVADPVPARRDILRNQYKVRAVESSAEAVEGAQVCILAVKPQDMDHALEELVPRLPEDASLISIAAGITTDWIRERTGETRRVARAMPNAAAVVRKSATGLYFAEGFETSQKEMVHGIFESVGTVHVVGKEDHLNIITGLSGSGPAYVFLFLEAFADAGVHLGLPRDVASALALGTFTGSAAMASEIGEPFPLLKWIITSPGGTTMAGLRVLEEDGVRAALLGAIEAATERSRELSL